MCLGVPGRVVEVMARHGVRMGRVDFDGIQKEVCLEYVTDVAVGEYVLVHVGFALTRLDEAEAQRVFDLLRELGDVDLGGDQPA